MTVPLLGGVRSADPRLAPVAARDAKDLVALLSIELGESSPLLPWLGDDDVLCR